MLELSALLSHFSELGYNVQISYIPKETIKLPGMHIMNPNSQNILDALIELLIADEKLKNVYIYVNRTKAA